MVGKPLSARCNRLGWSYVRQRCSVAVSGGKHAVARMCGFREGCPDKTAVHGPGVLGYCRSHTTVLVTLRPLASVPVVVTVRVFPLAEMTEC